MIPENTSFNHYNIHEIQVSLIKPVLLAGLIFGFIGLMASLSRVFEFGWLPVMWIQSLAYLVIVLVFIFRNHLPLKIIFIVIISLFLIVGTTGLFYKGLLSSGIFWYVAVGITAMYILGNRAALIIMAIGLIIMLIIGTLYINGVISYNFDMQQYAKAPSTWILEFFSAVLIFSLIYASTYKLHYSFLASIKDANAKEQNLRHIINSTTDGITLLNNEGYILVANKSFGEMLGVENHKLIGHQITDFVEKDAMWVLQLTQTHLDEIQQTFKIHNIKGEELELEFNSKTIDYQNEDVVLTVVRNLSAEKKLQQDIMKAIIETEERERGNFAKELHDGVGPVLSTTRMYLDLLNEELHGDEQAELMSRLQESFEDALQSLKEISNNISPHVLKNFGLSSAIKNFIDKHNGLLGVQFHFNDNLQERLAENIETSLYRISIELINNTLKYAQANHVIIKLHKNQNNLNYTFTHDGSGFDYVKTIEQKKGMGLYNLVHRVRLIGGEIIIDTAPDKNLNIFITLELPEQNPPL